MSREVIKLALEARLFDDAMDNYSEQIENFAKLVASAEREACAVACDSVYHQNIGPAFGEVRYGIAACSTAIRARSQS